MAGDTSATLAVLIDAGNTAPAAIEGLPRAGNAGCFSLVDAAGQRWRRSLRAKPGAASPATLPAAPL